MLKYKSEDITRELREFCKAGRIFKPLSGIMASRFTSEKSTPKTLGKTGLHLKIEGELNAEPILNTDSKVEDTSTYGVITRCETEFYPARLLCKRFNVSDPHLNDNDKETPGQNYQLFTKQAKKEALDKGTFENMILETQIKNNVQLENNITKTLTAGKTDNEVPDLRRPPMDLFKAIFDSDDE